MEIIRVIYEQDEDTWVASSPEVPGWTVVADSYDEAHQLAEEGVRFALDRDDVELRHLVLHSPTSHSGASALRAKQEPCSRSAKLRRGKRAVDLQGPSVSGRHEVEERLIDRCGETATIRPVCVEVGVEDRDLQADGAS